MTDPLTAREMEVLRVYVQCGRVTQVARELCLSVDAVNTHLNHARIKLHLETRTQLVAHAVERGWHLPHSLRSGA